MPRFVFGNWWSRYWPYKEQEYKTLVERFENEDIPFSVAVLDMDWHLVDIPAKYGSGWTGYTWNKELFPDPKSFLDWLHARHLKVTLNLHPADGVRAYEEMYPEMAVKMGIDPETGDPILFDINNRFSVMRILSTCTIRRKKMVLIFGGLTGSRGQTVRLKGLILCGF